MEITSEQIKLLREKTGAGMLNCKKALLEAEGDFEKAESILKNQGLASAEKKKERATKQGIITSYIHTGSKIGVLLELNCETDFVAKRVEFQSLAKSLAMEITALENFKYIYPEEVPSNLIEQSREIASKSIAIQTLDINEKSQLLEEQTKKTLKALTLIGQKSPRNPNISLEDLINLSIALLGENIKIGRVAKFVLGEEVIQN